METIANPEVLHLQEARDQAFNHLFQLDEHTNEPPGGAMRWTNPADSEDRLKDYVKAEVGLIKGRVKNARPGYDDEAQKDELIFSNAANWLNERKNGKDSLERVLKRLYRFQKQREYSFVKSEKDKLYGERQDYQREWINILSCQLMVRDLAGKLIGPESREKFTYPHLLWKDYE
jgi:hypothetical protein